MKNSKLPPDIINALERLAYLNTLYLFHDRLIAGMRTNILTRFSTSERRQLRTFNIVISFDRPIIDAVALLLLNDNDALDSAWKDTTEKLNNIDHRMDSEKR